MKRRHGSLVVLLVLAVTAPAQAARRDVKTPALGRDRVAAESALERARDLPAGRERTSPLAQLAARYAALAPAEQREADRLLARPTDGGADPQQQGWTVAPHAPFCTANFCLHWVTTTEDAPEETDTDGDDVPDYVESMAANFETSRTRENGDLGWRAPVSDGALGGDGRVDVYLVDLDGTGTLGYAATDPGQANPHQKFAYIVMDQNLADGDLEVTAAHEYNHVLQFAYDAAQDSWMFESTAVWMEDLVFDDVDHYLGFVTGWATADESPLTGTVKQYGSAVWPMWLDSRYGSTLIRSAWSGSATATPASFGPAAYDAALTGGGHEGFSASFARFVAAVAEWRTASQFPEGGAYPDAQRRGNLQVGSTPVSPVLDHTAYALYTVPQPAGGWPAVLRLDGELPAGVSGALAVVARVGGDNQAGAVTTQFQQLPDGGAGSIQLENPASFGRITAVLVNSDADTTGFSGGDWAYAADGMRFAAAAGPSSGTSAAPVNTAAPAISGTPQDGRTLTASNGAWSGSAPMGYARQWERCDDTCTDIAGATGATYVATSADVGEQLRVRVTASNGAGNAAAESAPTAAVAAVAPANVTPPAIDDTTPVVGQELHVIEGTWTGSEPLTIAYQWLRCTTTGLATCADIAGATSSSYVVAAGDEAKYLRVRATASNAAPVTATRTTAVAGPVQPAGPSAPTNTALPAITGTARDGQALTASDGTWTGSPAFTRQWLRCDDAACTEIGGATGTTYVVQPQDVGSRLRVEVTASNDEGDTVARSDPTPVVAAEPPAPVSAPVLSGAGRAGETLTATTGGWTGTDPDFAFQWLRCGDDTVPSCADIGGATGSSYLLEAADVGKRVRVRVTATNGAGSASALSEPSAVIAAEIANTKVPKISGIARDGEELTATPGEWAGAPAITRTWLRCTGASCVAIPAATGLKYRLTSADVGHTIKVRETAGTLSADSAPTAVVAATPPTSAVAPVVSGAATQGSTLTSTAGTWNGTPPIVLTRRWQRCPSGILTCADIPGAAGETYTLGLADVLAEVRVVVRAQNAGGTATAASALLGPVAAAPASGGPGPAPPSPPPGSPPPAVLAATFQAPARAKLAKALAGKLAAQADCTAACSVTARLEVKRRLARKLRVAPVLARGSATLATAGRATVRLRFTAKARKRLRKARKVAATLVVQARDASGALQAQRRAKLTLAR